MNDIGPNQYRCACCKSVFESGWTDEEASAELAEKFPGSSKAECAVVCDNCYNEFFVDGDLLK